MLGKKRPEKVGLLTDTCRGHAKNQRARSVDQPMHAQRRIPGTSKSRTQQLTSPTERLPLLRDKKKHNMLDQAYSKRQRNQQSRRINLMDLDCLLSSTQAVMRTDSKCERHAHGISTAVAKSNATRIPNSTYQHGKYEGRIS